MCVLNFKASATKRKNDSNLGSANAMLKTHSEEAIMSKPLTTSRTKAGNTQLMASTVHLKEWLETSNAL